MMAHLEGGMRATRPRWKRSGHEFAELNDLGCDFGNFSEEEEEEEQ